MVHLPYRLKDCLFRRLADVAQLAEQLICNQQVRGSIPLVSSGWISVLLTSFFPGQAPGSRGHFFLRDRPEKFGCIPLRNSLYTSILPVCLFSGNPSDAGTSGLYSETYGLAPRQHGCADTL